MHYWFNKMKPKQRARHFHEDNSQLVKSHCILNKCGWHWLLRVKLSRPYGQKVCKNPFQLPRALFPPHHNNDVIIGALASQITNLTIVYSTVYSGPDQRKHQSSASLPFVRGIHRWPVNSPHKGTVTRKMSPFDDVIMVMTSRMPLNPPVIHAWLLMNN